MNELHENARMNIRKFERFGEILNIVVEEWNKSLAGAVPNLCSRLQINDK